MLDDANLNRMSDNRIATVRVCQAGNPAIDLVRVVMFAVWTSKPRPAEQQAVAGHQLVQPILDDSREWFQRVRWRRKSGMQVHEREGRCLLFVADRCDGLRKNLGRRIVHVHTRMYTPARATTCGYASAGSAKVSSS